MTGSSGAVLLDVNLTSLLSLLVLQVSVVGVIRSAAPVLPGVHYSVDDMTSAPLIVKQWADSEASDPSSVSNSKHSGTCSRQWW